jgi:hypothetical protein
MMEELLEMAVFQANLQKRLVHLEAHHQTVLQELELAVLGNSEGGMHLVAGDFEIQFGGHSRVSYHRQVASLRKVSNQRHLQVEAALHQEGHSAFADLQEVQGAGTAGLAILTASEVERRNLLLKLAVQGTSCLDQKALDQMGVHSLQLFVV